MKTVEWRWPGGKKGAIPLNTDVNDMPLRPGAGGDANDV